MKIVAIMGSPKGKGDGYNAVRAIERHMKDMGEVEFEYVFLKDANLGMCKGCLSCAPLGEDKCPLQDDLPLIREKMLMADGLILSSPIYARSVTGLMKNFIDRLAYTISRPAFFHQKVLLVLNSGSGVGLKGPFTSLTWAVNGARIVHRLHVFTPWYPQQEKTLRQNEKAIRVGAEKLFKACLDKKLPDPGIPDYLMFRFLKAFFIGQPDYSPACYEFYRGKEYYYEAKISPLARLAAFVILPPAMLVVKDLMPADGKETHKTARSNL